MVPEMELELGMFRQLETDNRIVIPILRKIRVDVFTFDAYMVPEMELELGMFRQLETDNRIVIPILGVKADAIPGRVNQLNFISMLPGVLYGQCSEICGRQHSNMPICLEMLRLKDFNT